LNCWNTSQEIKDFLAKDGLKGTEEELLNLWGDFQKRAFSLVSSAKKEVKLPLKIYLINLKKFSY